jgi:hypothetical protein
MESTGQYLPFKVIVTIETSTACKIYNLQERAETHREHYTRLRLEHDKLLHQVRRSST